MSNEKYPTSVFEMEEWNDGENEYNSSLGSSDRYRRFENKFWWFNGCKWSEVNLYRHNSFRKIEKPKEKKKYIWYTHYFLNENGIECDPIDTRLPWEKFSHSLSVTHVHTEIFEL